MSRVFAPIGLGLLVWLVGCASYDLVPPPTREADLYPFADVRGGVAVAVDEITDPPRARRYFGADLLDAGILPVQVIVSNHGERRIAVRPADVLLLRGRKVVDPLPLEEVTAVPKRRGLLLTDATAARIDAFFEAVAFREVVLAPGETYQGVLFFQGAVGRSRASRFFRVVSLYLEPSLRLRLVATDLETRERLAFGPFGLWP